MIAWAHQSRPAAKVIPPAAMTYQDNPVRHDYRLTPKGRSLWPVVTAMRQWGDDRAAPADPPLELIHKPCGHTAVIAPVCSHCGEHATRSDLQPVLGPGARTPALLPVPVH
ncbi:winged helix-turn-helix transcriptional regulator [Nocardia sp. NPDC046473]|uniref:winged helix-turn-helix transcriptional regulator n=1 Tax=Nocardia sp. NPDC046473 TaxID=3155733 RepID=UPI0033C78813